MCAACGRATVSPYTACHDGQDHLGCTACGEPIDLDDLAADTTRMLRHRGFDAADLHDAVRATASAYARHVNGGGLDAQVPYLLTVLGLRGVAALAPTTTAGE